MTLTAISASDTPFLPRGVRTKFDSVRDMWVLLAPERAVKLDPIGAAILAEVDGDRTLDDIAGALAAKYNAPVDQIKKDAGAFLMSLIERRMVEIR